MTRTLVVVALIAGLLAGCSGAASPTLLPSERLAVDVASVEMLQLESYPVQLVLHVTGWLPNACAQPDWIVAGPDRNGRIEVELFALPESNEACIQVLAPLDVNIPLGPAPGNTGLEIVLNGQVVVRQLEG
jgi:hypothetical protein